MIIKLWELEYINGLNRRCNPLKGFINGLLVFPIGFLLYVYYIQIYLNGSKEMNPTTKIDTINRLWKKDL